MEIKIKPFKKTSFQNEIQLELRGKEIVLGQKDMSAGNAVQKDVLLAPKDSIIKKVLILQCGIVRVGNQSNDSPPAGTELQLLREPDNPYDKWAVKICYPAGISLGYLPSSKNQSLARLMDAGKSIKAYVTDEQREAVQYSEYPNYRPYRREDLSLTISAYMEIIVRRNDLNEQ